MRVSGRVDLGLMHIHLPEPAERKLREEAAKQNASPEDLASRLLMDQLGSPTVSREDADSTNDFDHQFTPERVAELAQISAAVLGGGKIYTVDEVEKHFDDKHDQWRCKNQVS